MTTTENTQTEDAAAIPPQANGADSDGAPESTATPDPIALDDAAGVADDGEPATPTTAQPPAIQPFAAAVSLLMASAQHRHLFLADLEWRLTPALRLNQYRLVHKDGRPVALTLWATVSDEVDARLSKGEIRLRPGDWRSGETVWLIDVVAPWGGVGPVLESLRQEVFKDREVKMPNRDSKTGAFRIAVMNAPEARAKPEAEDQE